MIYEVYLNDNLLYYPNDDTYVIFNAKLETALNEAGSIEFDIPESNLRYADFDNGAQLRSGIISVLKDGTEIFCGEVREVTQNFDFTRTVYAVGELAYLFDSIQPQAVYQGTVTAMFTSLLANHNSQVENRKKFQKGNVLVTDANNYIYHFTNREDTLTDIREKLCNTLNGYLKIRKVNGVKYLDLIPLSNYGKYCQQEIQFGENLLDYSQNYTAENIATCIIPLGVRFEDDQRTAAAIPGLDEYLTIKGTSVDSYHTNKNYDYIYIQSAVNRFGWVRVVKQWDDVTIAENLKTKAEAWLQSAQYAQMELNLSAVDLALINQDIESFEVGDTVHCWAEPYGMDTTFPVRKKTIYLNDFSKNNITLSNTEVSKSYTKQASDAVNQLKEEMPQIYPLLEESKKTALAMLLSETQGGYIVYEYHYNTAGKADYITAINICNAPTIDASVSRWRWSYNGLGFMTRDNTRAPWSAADAAIAITNDGKINATRIMTGELNAGRIKGGTLTLGGSNNVNGSCVVKNAAGNDDFVTLNSNGITAKRGYIGNSANGWTIKDNAIYNGPDSIGSASNGTYLGVDGIKNKSGETYTQITGGKITSTSVDLTGKVTATSGYIGNKTAGWTIANTAIYNGISSVSGGGNGTYVGVNGFCNQNGNTKTSITGGKITSNSVDLTGKINAKEGYIGNGTNGWTIANTALYNGPSEIGSIYTAGTYLGTNGILNSNGSKYTQITNGKITSNDVDLAGKITATEGYIGNYGYGWTIGNTAIYNGLSSISGVNDGVYLGTDGFCNKYGLSSTKITGGKITSNDVDLTGKVTATSGFIGSTSGWTIGSTAIYNGISSVDGGFRTAGTYVGINGICNQGGYDNQAKVTIKDGAIVSNSTIQAAGVYGTTTVSAPTISGQQYWTNDGVNEYQGKSPQTFVVEAYVGGSSSQTMVGLTFKNGLLVGVSGA